MIDFSPKPYYLLDTCIISEFAKPKPNLKLLEKCKECHAFCAISVITWQELLYGVQLLPKGTKKEALLDFVYNIVRQEFPIIDYDSSCATIFADICARCKENGVTRPYSDAQIASTAIANNFIFVTRNVNDFIEIQKHSTLMLDNWFE